MAKSRGYLKPQAARPRNRETSQPRSRLSFKLPDPLLHHDLGEVRNHFPGDVADDLLRHQLHDASGDAVDLLFGQVGDLGIDVCDLGIDRRFVGDLVIDRGRIGNLVIDGRRAGFFERWRWN